jgi:hypothetical protein
MSSFYEALKKFNYLKKNQKYLPNFFFLQSQKLFEIIRTHNNDEVSINRNVLFFKSFFIFFLNFIFILKSGVTFLKLALLKKKYAHYQICINNNKYFSHDARSNYIINVLPAQNTLNIIILNDLKYGLATIFNYKNAIYPLQIKFFLKFFISKKKVTKCYNKSKKFLLRILDKKKTYYYSSVICESEVFIKFFKFLFKFLKIERIYMIDDVRHCNEFIEVARSLNIKTYGYQHARVNEYHVGIGQICFDNYILWNDYSKKKIIRLNTDYSNKNLFTVGHPLVNFDFKIKKNKIVGKTRILIIAETGVNYKQLYKFYDKILENKNYEIYLREKKGQVVSKSLLEYSKIDRFNIDKESNLFDSLSKNKINIVIGTQSTVLIETWIVGIPSIMLKSDLDYGYHLYEDGLVDLVKNVSQLNFVIRKNLKYSTYELEKKRDLIWGQDFSFNKKNLLMALDL